MNSEASALNNEEKTTEELLFDIIELLNQRYIGLDPITILNSDTMQVLDLWTATIIHDKKAKKGQKNGQTINDEEIRERVTSKTATWH